MQTTLVTIGIFTIIKWTIQGIGKVIRHTDDTVANDFNRIDQLLTSKVTGTNVQPQKHNTDK